jgi:hypothetical protein
MQRLAAELQFISRWRLATLEHRLLVSGLCGVMCLLIAGPALGVENRFDGAYIGKRTLTKGFGSMCPANDNVSVDIHGETLTFTNSRLQSFVMGFHPRQDGSFHQSHVHSQGAFVSIRGRVIGDLIEADVTNPPCEHHWHLKKVIPGR